MFPAPVPDRPPFAIDAIVERVPEGTCGFYGRPSIRAESFRQRTNTASHLSIARARFSNLVSTAAHELGRYSQLLPGWDGYHGEPISPSAIQAAFAIIMVLQGADFLGSAEQQLTDIIPGPASDGSLDLELRGNKRRLIITIYPAATPGDVEIRTFRTDGAASEEKNNIEPDALVEDLRWVLA